MVVCAVKLCRNYTGKNIKPPEGISFHRFPIDKEQKQEWIRAISRESSWAPGTHCRVCSVHFENTDFKISDTGRRILLKDAVPTKNLYKEEREDVFRAKKRILRASRPKLTAVQVEETDGLNACRGCLALSGAMYELTDKLADMMAQLTNGVPSPKEDYPRHLCAVCCTLLHKFSEFKSRCDTAQDILNDAKSQELEITPEFLRTIDRQTNGLMLPFTIKNFPVIDLTDSQTTVKEEADVIDVLDNDTLMSMSNDMTDLNEMNDSADFDIFDRPEMLIAQEADLPLADTKLFDTDVKIEHNQFVLETERGKTKVYASVVQKHEIFVDVDVDLKKKVKSVKSEKKKGLKRKKVKVEKDVPVIKRERKEDVRNTKPRKTDEDYENFAKVHSAEIVFLTREEQIAEVEARKDSDNYKNSRFKCDECYKGFTSELAFNNHKAIHDPSVGNYMCEACKFRFPKRYKLLHHLTQHKMNFICKLCGHISKLASKAMEHFKWHNGVIYPCHYCDRIFYKRTSQFNHMRNRHGSAACDICQEVFSGARGLTAHMQKAHKEALKSRCKTCGVQFHTEEAMNRHTDSLPAGVCTDEVKACAECGDNFVTEDILNDHMKMNHWKEIKCEKCNANFENEKLYRMHKVIHKEVRNRKPRDAYTALNKSSGGKNCKIRTKRPPIHSTKRMCEMCGLTARSAAALKYHQRVHTGEKPHQCPLCPKSFRIQDSLQIHMNTHTGARPFKCPHCPKAFKSRTQNHKHQLVHTKVRRYRCDLCDKTFQTSTCVKTHIKTVHMKLPAPPRSRRRATQSPTNNIIYSHDKIDVMTMGLEARE